MATGLIKLVSAPFKAAGKALEKNKLDTYANGLYFDTSTPAGQLRQALSEHFDKAISIRRTGVFVRAHDDGPGADCAHTPSTVR